MSRNLPGAITTELAKDKITYVDLIELHFDGSDAKYLNNGQFNITVNTTTSTGETFLANGNLLSFDMVSETESAKVNEINIVLSGVDTTFANLFLNGDYVERRVVIYRQFFDQAGAKISTPVMMFDGEIKNFTLKEDTLTNTISITSASVFYNFDDNNGRRSTAGSQQRHFPTDQGMNYAAQTTQDIRWGRPDA